MYLQYTQIHTRIHVSVIHTDTCTIRVQTDPKTVSDLRGRREGLIHVYEHTPCIYIYIYIYIYVYVFVYGFVHTLTHQSEMQGLCIHACI